MVVTFFTMAALSVMAISGVVAHRAPASLVAIPAAAGRMPTKVDRR